jgi:hypothetical protein
MEFKVAFTAIWLVEICHQIIFKVNYEQHERKVLCKYEFRVIDVHVLNAKVDYVSPVFLLHETWNTNQIILRSQKV